MNEGATQHNEADNGPDQGNRALPLRIQVRRRMRQGQGSVGLELRARFDCQEEGADAHGAEVPDEQRLGGGAHVGQHFRFVEGEDDRDAAEDEDQGEQGEEAAWRDGVGLGEGFPRDHGAEEDEKG